MSESEEADNSDNDNENDKTPSTDPISDDARTPPQKRVVKTRNPKRRKKSSVPDRKIKQEIVSEQEAKKLSPVRRHQSARSGKTPSKLNLQKHNARKCNNYKKITTDTGTTTVRKDIPFKPKDKPAEGKHKKRRKSEMLKVVRQYAAKHMRPYFNSPFYQPRLAAADRRLTEPTLPELKPTKWIPANKSTGASGYTQVDPRRKKSLRVIRKLQ
jgi:hypothetical protein